MERDNVLILAINSISFLKTKEKLFLYDLINVRSRFAALSLKDLCDFTGRSLNPVFFDPAKLLKEAELQYRYLQERKISYKFYWDRDYPQLLREIYDSPFVLFYRGVFPASDVPSVGIVGTRYPKELIVKESFSLAYEFALLGIPVVSGLAKGVDSSAHFGSVKGNGKTVAVLGCGIDKIYPGENKGLAWDIIDKGGCILSEYCPGVPPLRYNFPKRNRLISALSRAVVIMEAPEKSGALITAERAIEQGKDVYVHINGLDGVNGLGCSNLESLGAVVIESSGDIIRDWGYKNKKKVESFGNEYYGNNPGLELAARMSEELSDNMIIHHGEYFRRK